MTDRQLRCLDVAIATTLLVVLSPLLGLVAAALLASQGRPVLYRAPRVGLRGCPIEMMKFRTMSVDSDKGFTSTTADDSRITPLGRRLRRYKVDELPQLVNVVRGEMSLVGPRPQVKWAVDRYNDADQVLLTVRPGVADLASVWFRDEGERLANAEDPDEAYLRLIEPGKNALARYYVEHRSVRLYFQTLALVSRSTFGRDVDKEIVTLTSIDADAMGGGA